MKFPFTIEEVKPSIFLFLFKDYYDMSMHFLRYQEYYESASPKFRGKNFEIFDFMRWYSKKYGKGAFTYPKDWGGFNIPGEVITKVYPNIIDYNKYDNAMWQAYMDCSLKRGNISKNPQFYIIGATNKGPTLRHEIAHGFFYNISEYKKEMTALVKSLKPSVRKHINKTLKNMGYTPKVYIDETQAYMATGLVEAFGSSICLLDRKPFIKLYKKYYDK